MSAGAPPPPAASAPAGSAAAEKLNTRAAGIVGLAVMCSRVLGLLREQVFAALFGGGRVMDAFTVAFRTPNLLRDLFAEGALSTAFITTFSRTIAREGDGAAWKLANKIATLTVVFLSVVVLIGICVAPYLVQLFAPGFDVQKAALTVHLARIMYPFIVLVSLAALVMGLLNARNVFGVPAMASSFFNLGSIAGGVIIGWWLDPHFGAGALTGLAIGTLIGGAMQLSVQLPALRRVGYCFHADFRWRDAGVRQVLKLMGPSVVAASTTQVNVLINSMFASTLGDGPIFWLSIAFRLMQLPLGLFGVALGTVTLPLLARVAAVGDLETFRRELARGMRLAFILTIPATAGLMMLAEPIVSTLYQHGRFTAADAAQAAGALRFYAIGLCGYAALKVLVNAFYAVDRRRTPMLVSFIAVAVNLACNWLFTFHLGWGHRGLAFSTGCVATLSFLILYGLMHRHLGRLETRALLGTLARVLTATAALALVCWASDHWLLADWATQRFVSKLGALLFTVVVGAGVYFTVAVWMRIGDVDEIVAALKRRLARRRGS
ncbi:MAG: murein biosynthesis integral membrane protein MurJ [Steroidobacteraceae bacterium]